MWLLDTATFVYAVYSMQCITTQIVSKKITYIVIYCTKIDFGVKKSCKIIEKHNLAMFVHVGKAAEERVRVLFVYRCLISLPVISLLSRSPASCFEIFDSC